MLKTAGWLLPAILALAGCSSSGQRHEQTLSQALATIGQDKALVGASSGVMVRDADSGTVLYQAHAQQRLAPASNMKMFTSLAAFGVLGADYRFETRLLTTGEQRGDTLQGDLYLQGSGDPTLHPDDLDTFAATLAQRGIRQIHGRLILDANAFDQTPFGAGWSWDDEPFAFAAPISALNYAFTPGGDINVVRVDVQPGARAGAPGQVSFYPANDAVTLVNRTTTGGDTALTFDRQPGSNRIVVSGTIAAQAETRSRLITVDQPARVIGALLQHALHAHGITLRGNAEEGVTLLMPGCWPKKLAAALPPGRHLPEGVQQRLRRGTDQGDGPQDAGQGGLGRRPAGDRPVCAKPGHRGRRLPSGRRFRAVAHEPNHGAAADDAAAGGQETAVVCRLV